MNFILSIISNLSLLSASFSANAGCAWIFHEQKMPENIDKILKR